MREICQRTLDGGIHICAPYRYCRVAGLLSLSVALVAGVFGLSLRLPPIADEPHHLSQIQRLMEGNWDVVPTLTTIPGYHAVIAVMGRAVAADDIISLRICSFVVSLCALATLLAVAKLQHDSRSVERLLQIAFLPILFPLIFLLYTDLAAILLFSLSLLLLSRKRYWASAAAAAATLLIRQNYVVWVAFLALLAIDVGARRERGSQLLRDEAGFILAMLCFVVFVVVNDGIAIGDRSMHPFPRVHLGNIYFALFLSFFLLLPLHIANAPAMASAARRPSVLAFLVVALPVFLLTFSADHPYNRPELNWWLHNRLLNVVTASVWAKLVMFVVAAASLLSLATTRFRQRTHYLMYPFAALSLLPSWQIEQRYYLCALILLLLFRVQHSRRFEWAFIAYLAAVTAVIFPGIAAAEYFL